MIVILILRFIPSYWLGKEIFLKSFKDKIVVITGAGSGIGRACAQEFKRQGARLHLLDRDKRVLDVANDLRFGVEAHVVDVTDAQMFFVTAEKILAKEGHVDIIHNNAGVCLSKAVEDLTMDDWRWIIDVNLWGVIHGIQAFVPPMIRRRQGHVINTASLAGLIPFPMVVPYCATKYAVVGLSEALAAELAPMGIGVTVECPGMVSTELFRSARVGWPDSMRGRFERIMDTRGTDPKKVARNILRAVRRRDVVHITAGPAYPLYLFKRVSWSLYGKMAGWVSGFKKSPHSAPVVVEEVGVEGTIVPLTPERKPTLRADSKITLEFSGSKDVSKEVEIKLGLCSGRDWRRLIDLHGSGSQLVLQENSFYDTQNGDLALTEWYFRVRNEWKNPLSPEEDYEDQSCIDDLHPVTLTLKGKSIKKGAAVVRPEIEKVLKGIEARRFMRGLKSIRSVWPKAGEFEELRDHTIDSLVLVDHFFNERVMQSVVLRGDEYFLAVDRTIFDDGHVDYEVELELMNSKNNDEELMVVESALRAYLSKLEVCTVPFLGGKLARAKKHRVD